MVQRGVAWRCLKWRGAPQRPAAPDFAGHCVKHASTLRVARGVRGVASPCAHGVRGVGHAHARTDGTQ